MIDEWENLFAKEVNLILIKCFMNFVKNQGKNIIKGIIYTSINIVFNN